MKIYLAPNNQRNSYNFPLITLEDLDKISNDACELIIVDYLLNTVMFDKISTVLTVIYNKLQYKGELIINDNDTPYLFKMMRDGQKSLHDINKTVGGRTLLSLYDIMTMCSSIGLTVTSAELNNYEFSITTTKN